MKYLLILFLFFYTSPLRAGKCENNCAAKAAEAEARKPTPTKKKDTPEPTKIPETPWRGIRSPLSN